MIAGVNAQDQLLRGNYIVKGLNPRALNYIAGAFHIELSGRIMEVHISPHMSSSDYGATLKKKNKKK
jgi:hypothetical protein